MASIFDLASNSKGFEKLQQIKNDLQEEREKREAERRKHAEEVHSLLQTRKEAVHPGHDGLLFYGAHRSRLSDRDA